jgi:hypothetical protein
VAITTLDGALAGMQTPRHFAKAVTPTLVAGKPQSLWALAGAPGAGSFDTTLNGVVLSSSSAMVAGQLPHVDPVSGNAYLARLQAAASQAGVLLLCDRLWHNGGFTITSTSAQAITSPAFPARDAAGSTNGDGVLIGLEVSAAAGAAAPTLTLAYTNQAGTASRSATNLDATANSPAAGSFFRLGLQAGDTGVRSVQSLTLSASWLSGTINLVAYRVLAALELTGANVTNAIDGITGGFPRLYNGVVPYLIFIPSTTTASNVSGTFVETQG